jgi:hypothetical protein
MEKKYVDVHGGMNGRLPEQYRLRSIEILPQDCCPGCIEWKIELMIKEPWWKGGKERERTFVGNCFEWKEITKFDFDSELLGLWILGWHAVQNRGWLDPYDTKIDFLNAIVSYQAHRFINLGPE